MFSYRACTFVFSAMLSMAAFVPVAHADSGYQPYYYSRDALQYAKPVLPAQVEPPAPTYAAAPSYNSAPPVFNTPAEIPLAAPPVSTNSYFPVDETRNAFEYNPQQVRVESGQRPPVVINSDDQRAAEQYNPVSVPAQLGMPVYHPIAMPTPEISDMGAGFGW